MFIKRFGALVLIILNVLFLASCKNAYQEFNNESKTFVSEVLNYYIATSKSLILPTEEEISYKTIFEQTLNENNVKLSKVVEYEYAFKKNYLLIVGTTKNNSYVIGVNLSNLETTLFNTFKEDEVKLFDYEDKLYIYQKKKQSLEIYDFIDGKVLNNNIDFPKILTDYYFKINNYLYRLTNDDKLVDALNLNTMEIETDILVNKFGERDYVYIEDDSYYMRVLNNNDINLYLNEELFKTFDIYQLYETSTAGKQVLESLGNDHKSFELVVLHEIVNNEFILFIYYQKGFLMNKGLLGRSNTLIFKLDYINDKIYFIYASSEKLKIHYWENDYN